MFDETQLQKMRRMCRDWENCRCLWDEQTKLNFMSILARWYDLIDIIKFVTKFSTQSIESIELVESIKSAQSIEFIKLVESAQSIQSVKLESTQSIELKSIQSIQFEWVDSILIFIFIFYSREYRETIYDFVEKHREIEKSRKYDREENTLTWSTLYRDREWR
jgi:hypothetical protein